MRIQRLKLKNWKTFDDFDKKFTSGLNIIEGNNYSGKTSLIQALYFAFFKETIYKQLEAEQLKKEGEKDAEVEVVFLLDGTRYRIRREISGTKSISVNSYLNKIDEQGEVIDEVQAISRKDEDLTKLDEEVLKCSREYLKNINFIQEGSIYQFMINPKYQIDKDLNMILRLDYLKDLGEHCVTLIKEKEKQIKALENQLRNYEEYHEENANKIETLENKIESNEAKKQEKTQKIKEKEVRLRIYKDLEDLENEKKKLEEEIESIKEKIENFSLKSEKLQENINEISIKMDKLPELERKVKILEDNKKKIENLRKEKDEYQKELNKIEGKIGRLKDDKKTLRNLEKEKTEKQKQLKDLGLLKRKRDNLKDRVDEYIGIKDEIEENYQVIEENEKMIKDFEKGECPISKEPCPVADDIKTKKEKTLSELKREQEKLKSSLSKLSNPTIEFEELNKKIEEIQGTQEEIEIIETNMGETRKKIKDAEENLPLKQEINDKLEECEGQIKRLEKSNENLESSQQEYIRIKERIKDKENLENDIQSNIEKIEIQKKELKINGDFIQEKEKEIKNLKDANDLSETAEISNLNTKIKELNEEINNIEKENAGNAASLKHLRKEMERLLKPFDSKEDLNEGILKIVHQKATAEFFQDSLQLTLNEIKEGKLREIKDLCNTLWCDFKQESRMESIDWSSEFTPGVNIEGVDRNFYQLSASERAMVYFSIRAALLGKLGPHPFLVVDNLLGPFMKENQDAVLNLIKDVLDNSNIEQIIFTAYDLDPSLSCDNKIIID